MGMVQDSNALMLLSEDMLDFGDKEGGTDCPLSPQCILINRKKPRAGRHEKVILASSIVGNLEIYDTNKNAEILSLVIRDRFIF